MPAAIITHNFILVPSSVLSKIIAHFHRKPDLVFFPFGEQSWFPPKLRCMYLKIKNYDNKFLYNFNISPA